MAITEFQGEYRFLSNFYPAELKRDFVDDDHIAGYHTWVSFPTVEHAFQASKCADPSQVTQFLHEDLTPGQAKRLGKTVRLRPDWEVAKDAVMEHWVRKKFTQHEYLANWLMATGDQELIEGNTWNDHYWGVCGGWGQNKLGKILMKIRLELVAKMAKRLELPTAVVGVAIATARETQEAKRPKEEPMKMTKVINIQDAPSGWEKDPQYVYCGRPGKGMEGPWGNPHAVGVECMKCEEREIHQRGKAIEAFRKDFNLAVLFPEGQWGFKSVEQLRGKICVCFCKPLDCHMDVPAQYLNAKKGEPSLTPVQPKPKIYAGIGSRDTPEIIIDLIELLAEDQAHNGWTCRSGNATGADQAWQRGAMMGNGQIEVYLPWSKFEYQALPYAYKNWKCFSEPTQEAVEMALKRFPWLVHKPGKNNSLWKLAGRNMHQILGDDLQSPVTKVLCWAPIMHSHPHEVKGGTNYAVAIANDWKIPVYNLNDKKVLEAGIKKVIERFPNQAQKFTEVK